MSFILNMKQRFMSQSKIFMISRFVLLFFSMIFSFLCFVKKNLINNFKITPFVLFGNYKTNFGEYIILFPCHFIGTLSFLGFILSLGSYTLSAVNHLIVSLLLFGHWTFLLTFEERGIAFRMGLVVEFFLLLISLLACILDFFQECKSPKIESSYETQIDEKDAPSI
jgi:hypothetical protein